jgi:hypothetical protein
MRPGVIRIFRLVVLLVTCLVFAWLLISQRAQPKIGHKTGGHDNVEGHKNTSNAKFRNRIVEVVKSNRKSASMMSSEKAVNDLDLGPGGRYWDSIAGDPGYLDLPLKEMLIPDLIQPDVHFLWCGDRWFEFKHYLSVMSVRRAIQPDKIYIHFENEPKIDRVYYNQVSQSEPSEFRVRPHSTVGVRGHGPLSPEAAIPILFLPTLT